MTEIKWTVTEYAGVEIYRNKQDLDALVAMISPPSVGEEILCPTFNGFVKAVVKQDQSDLYAEAGGFVCPLEFSDDSRKCWIASGMINLAGIKKLNLMR